MKTIIAGGRDYRMSNGDFAHLDVLRESLPTRRLLSEHPAARTMTYPIAPVLALIHTIL